jgi:MoxR-like ATPase
MEADTETLAWHFTSGTLRDGRPIPPAGEWLVHDGPIKICHTGLHASVRLIDALSFAPGHTLHRVTLRGVKGSESDKLGARERRIEWTLNAEPVLRAFARRCALDVLPLWPDAPDAVREYLETGREDIRDAASAAAWDAARAGAWDAAWAATWDAASAAAWDAARDAQLGLYNTWLTEMVEAAHAEQGQ